MEFSCHVSYVAAVDMHPLACRYTKQQRKSNFRGGRAVWGLYDL